MDTLVNSLENSLQLQFIMSREKFMLLLKTLFTSRVFIMTEQVLMPFSGQDQQLKFQQPMDSLSLMSWAGEKNDKNKFDFTCHSLFENEVFIVVVVTSSFV